MSRVRILNCGVPRRGCHVEFGLEVDGQIVFKSQVFPDGNLGLRAEEEALLAGQLFYFNERGERVDFTHAAEVGAIRGPLPSPGKASLPYIAYVRGENGWLPVHGNTSGEALRNARDYSNTMIGGERR